MEQRAQRTTNALRALDSRVKNTSVTLNNTINSLVALQSGNQFVESCIQDDDDLVDQPRTTNVDVNTTNFHQNTIIVKMTMFICRK